MKIVEAWIFENVTVLVVIEQAFLFSCLLLYIYILNHFLWYFRHLHYCFWDGRVSRLIGLSVTNSLFVFLLLPTRTRLTDFLLVIFFPRQVFSRGHATLKEALSVRPLVRWSVSRSRKVGK